MLMILKILGIVALVLLGLFVLSLIIFFFNLDVKLSASLVPVLVWYHDKAAVRRQKKARKNK